MNGRSSWPLISVLVIGLVVAVGFAVRTAFTPDAAAGNPPVSERSGDMLLVNAYADEPDGDWASAGTSLKWYAWLFNDGSRDDRLVSVSTPVAESVEVSGTALPATLPAQDWLSFEPRGQHLLLRDLTRPVRAGETFPVTFYFAGNEPLTAQVIVVERASATTPPPRAP
jgi:hypothetical protein